MIELAHLTVAQKAGTRDRRQPASAGCGLGRRNAGLGTGRADRRGIRPALTGFEDAEIEALLTGAVAVAMMNPSPKPTSLTRRRRALEAPVVSVSRPGDLWQLARIA